MHPALPSPRRRACCAHLLVTLGVALLAAPSAFAQEIGALVSPGPLSAAHAKLEGIKNCDKCHEPGKKVTVARCLACHKPVAERIAARKGVHRAVTDDCVTCHVEHAGIDAELRPLDKARFDHRVETGFVLDGKHAAIAKECTKCHTTRSYLAAKPECASCHKDPHNGSLGPSCTRCHSTAAAFAAASAGFDHSTTAFVLAGAHLTVACEKCHVNKVYKGLKFAKCGDCHKDPHSQRFGSECASCHTAASWRTDKVDHARTSYPLVGKHAVVACVSCHVKPALQVKLDFARCASCHADPHKGTFKADCATCHNVQGFGGAPFDHAAKTAFPLTGKHAAAACAACHKQVAGRQAGRPVTADFRGLKQECASCHKDVHGGEFGANCASCHGTASFAVTTYTHPRMPEFFAGSHAGVACVRCHGSGPIVAGAGGVPRRYRGLSLDCATCHKDVHLGQLGGNCASCHAIAAPKFQAPGFSHANTKFALTGKHATAACASCHKSESAAFPDGSGTATRYAGLDRACASCHKDVHLGQLGAHCESCHNSGSFAVPTYEHRGQPEFFVGQHRTAQCQGCHKRVEDTFPSGHGVAVRFASVATACASCHQDPHQGALGTACASCHAVGEWRTPSRAFHKGTKFPLTGAHVRVPCTSCHVDGQTKGTPTQCYDCHWVRKRDDRFETRLGAECERCHNTSAWTSVDWNHATATGFALNSAHSTLDCASCHTGGQFASAPPTQCIECHRNDFQRATNPPHSGSGFPTDCTLCHKATDTGWAGATFDHTPFFPLAGVHASQACASCHVGGVYQGTTRECVGCHQPVYQSSANPNHTAAKFSTACETCHHADDPSWSQGRYAHTTWPLQGAHVAPTCTTCHTHDVFAGMGTQCVTCHLTAYQQAKNPEHATAGFPTACEGCHKVSDTLWSQAKFDHAAVFPLLGVHATEACASCHVGGVYKGTTRECVGCHQPVYQTSTNPNHTAAKFSTACETCHHADDPTWAQGRYAHTTWPLQGAHVTPTCTTCHTHDVFAGMGTQCVTCHLTAYQQAKNPEHATAGFPTACEGCHKVSDTLWSQAKFDHAAVFPLLGVHATEACASCHVGGVYKGTTRECVGCHQPVYQTSTNPNHTAAKFSTACETCHHADDPSWSQGRYAHTTWPLQGAHVTPTCTTCHTHDVFAGMGTQCVTCHLTAYQQAKNPEHATAGFPTACEGCHKVSDTLWSQAKFDHAAVFPLLGVHATEACASCHVGGVYKGTTRECVGCHQPVYQTSTNPNHTAAKFSTACETCHHADDPTWAQGRYAHTTWPLQGAHVTPTCTTCHTHDVFAGMGTQCVTCHLTAYQQAKNPEHATAGFPTACEGCHKVSDTLWSQAKFDHAAVFPLLGVHATEACASCHVGGVYKGTTRECVGCHQPVYQTSTNPNHTAAKFSTACETCHHADDPTWAQGRYAHTTWPLQGAHVTPTCTTCHSHNVYAGMGSTCVSCHLAAYQQTTQPNHTAAGFPTACEGCHKVSDINWSKGTFDHGGFFPLVGVHAAQVCASCHVGGVYKGTTRECVGCHRQAYLSGSNPNHTAAKFSTACETCHHADDPSWSEGRYAHTVWPLLGAHVTPTCTTCHSHNVYAGMGSTCVSCHLGVFQQTTQPNHTAAGFPTECQACHKVSDTSWSQGTFDHNSFFPLLGVHAAQQCASCHIGGVYKGTSRDCVGCHQPVYQSATNPNHAAAGFSTACEPCHHADDPSWAQGRYAHTVWPLQGAHVTPTCTTCHSHNVYAGMGSTCVSCHLGVFQQTTQPNHTAAGFPTECQACHKVSDTSWSQGTFDHNSFFPLVGVHAAQVCASCHIGGVYKGTSRTCVGCHQSVYQTSTNPNHTAAKFSAACETCHHADDPTWAQGRYAHTTWPLLGAHVTPTCTTCHSHNVYAGMGSQCVSCHLAAYQQAKQPDHVAAGFPTECQSCHKVSDTSWSQGTFDHNSFFPLVGVHAAQVCASCHIGGVYKGTSRTCVGCHQSVYQTSTNPNHTAAKFSAACETCHHADDTSWAQGRYAHTVWPLLGAHVTPTCTTCHSHNVYAGMGSTCVSCHLAAYQQAKQPDHVAAGFPTECQTCHKISDTSWAQGTFDHSSFFPLLGVHAAQVCASCHIGGVYKGTTHECVGCHRQAYQSGSNPNHTAAGFSTACEPCHHADDPSWSQGRYAHTVWPLLGAHVTPTCTTCHSHNVYAGMGSQCVSCHLAVYQQAKQPDHVAAGFPTECQTCHKVSDTSWNQGTFDHNSFFPLVSVHAAQQCAACHIGGVYKGTSRTCVGCHQSVYQSSTNPNHTAAGFSTACEPCHHADDPSWGQGRYAHTVWRLVGAHVTPTCTTCHSHNVYAGMGSTCVSCHLAAYQQAKQPDHVAAGFPTECQTCHKVSDTTWSQGTFDHSSFFPLVGVHGAQQCASCHVGGVYKGTSRDCVGCHQPVYQSATNPNHAAAGFSAACEPCHHADDPSWAQGRYAHTVWPLLGAHVTPTCTTCHSHNVYAGMGSQCVTCHLAAYQQAKQPDHVAAGFPTECQTCHKVSDTSWSQGTFDHSSFFPLVGVHGAQQCASCHVGGVYKGTSRDCVGCHQSVYQSSTNPNHTAAGFSTACEPCHLAGDPSWGQGRYAHTVWPLLGAHITPTCTTCHSHNVYAGMGSQCVSCHLAAYQQAKQPDHVAAGFPTECQSCHKVSDTSWAQGTFDHSSFFPLVGVHAAQQCASCHIGGVYKGTSRDCVGCHQPIYQSSTNPNHTAAGFSTVCEPCHHANDPSWVQGRYAHSVWPLLGAHITPTCTTCHSHNVYAGMGSTCVSCHLAAYQQTTQPNHIAAGFPTECQSCHKVSDTSWSQGTFDHNSFFPLVGVHAAQVCASCHIGGVYKGTSRTCVGCHQSVYQSATNPNHTAAGFSTACEPCHQAGDPSWGQGRYAHTVWRLVGAHVTPTCTTCHSHNVYAGMGSTCVSCHLAAYQQTTQPNHIAAGFPTACETCHRVSDTSWNQGSFDHSLVFRLVGVHATQPCASCHVNGVYRGTPSDCAGCHLSVYQSATNPNHVAAGFSTACEPCHHADDPSWDRGRYAHTVWPLLGAHVTPTCTTCHSHNVYAGMGSQCVSCHLTQYQQTTQPNHAAAGFPTACETCHKVYDLSWTLGTFDHNAFFPLLGVHATQQCAACHIGGVYQGTPRDCVGCHRQVYLSSTNPNHTAAGFSTVCEPCHHADDPSWDRGRYGHAVWPLLGAHVAPTCATCHSHNVYAGMGSACVSCHLAAYQSTTDPNHASAGFPTTCETCHRVSDTSWNQGRFDHSTVFPLLGVHATQPCAACHKNGVYRGTPRTCVGCHLTDYQNTRDPNHAAAGFPTTCDTCHRATDTSWDQGRFNHTWFPITSGRHSGIPCATCHINSTNFVIFSCTNGCHPRGETDGHHQEVSGYRYDSLACYSCHPTGRSD